MCMLFKNVIIIKLYCIMYCFFPSTCNGDIDYILEGLSPELEYNVRKQFSKIDLNINRINSLDFQKKNK